MSTLLLNDLADAVDEIVSHHTKGTIFLGYIDGWMLTPCEEVRLRRALRTLSCIAISHFPLSLSNAWQNEIDWVYTDNINGLCNTHNNGGSLHDGRTSEYGPTRA